MLLLSSLFACVQSFHNVMARYQFVLAGRGPLPRRLATVHPAHHSPSTSSEVQSVTALFVTGGSTALSTGLAAVPVAALLAGWALGRPRRTTPVAPAE
ncbi:hypothetical protein [Nocardioides hwasunensis]|uniref:hypothetical protein n=1 Tax=Nocardioides hwasunensis TaxID=397258 RepID=UPI001CD160C5|nr:hypothetical protein [Nocardioides hwasunensis]